MCGICGIACAEPGQEVSPLRLKAMADTLRFRGPDAEGYCREPGVGLGHRRLAVIDLAGGAQPMTDAHGLVTLVYNGEIYNFRALRKELQAAGYRFSTSSDTEVLLLGYLHWGEAVLDRLVGMFAFALWDRRDQSVFLARDRFGVKPLYWAQTARGDLVFGSELTAVLASGLIAPRLNRDAVAQYLALGYVVGEESILEGIWRLPAGACLRWTRLDGARVRVYWDMAARWAELAQRPAPRDDLHQFATLLQQATSERLVSDVPLGVLLSGGLDSTVVAALMKRAGGTVRSFSFGFREASYDERPWARQSAEHLGTDHLDGLATCDTAELLLEIAGRLDEPFADTSIVPTHALCRMTRQHVTVALTGDGGDELLAGYVTHQADAWHRWACRVPRALLGLMRGALSLVPDSRRKVNSLYKAKQFLAGAHLDPCDAHAWWRMLADARRVAALLPEAWHPERSSPFEPFRQAWSEAAALRPLDRMLYVDYKTWLVDDILVKIDRASMAYGLELRSPFMDHRLFEFCATLPPERKLSGRTSKVILRQLAGSLVPPAVLRRRKAGFNAPVAHWLVGSWRDLVEEYLGPRRVRNVGVLRAQAVRELLQEHRRGMRDHGYLLFALLQLALWFEKVRPALPAGVDRTGPPLQRSCSSCVG